MAVRWAVMLEIPSMAIRCGRYSRIVGAGNPSLAALFGGMKHEKETARDGEPYTVQPLMLSVNVSRLRQGEERAGEREDGVELGEYGENHGLGEDIVAVGHLVDTVAYEAGLLDG